MAVALGLYVIRNGWITFALYHAGLISCIFLAGQRRIFEYIFSGWDWIAGVISITCCSLIGPLLWFLWPFISTEPENLSAQLAGLGLKGLGWLTFIFIFVAVNPVMEEVFWRGFLESRGNCKEILPWIVNIIFAGYHLPILIFFIKPMWLILTFIVICMGGWAWQWLSRKFDGLAVPLISHISADISIVIAVQIIAN